MQSEKKPYDARCQWRGEGGQCTRREGHEGSHYQHGRIAPAVEPEQPTEPACGCKPNMSGYTIHECEPPVSDQTGTPTTAQGYAHGYLQAAVDNLIEADKLLREAGLPFAAEAVDHHRHDIQRLANRISQETP